MRLFLLTVILFPFVAFSQGEFIIEIDRTNGSFVKTGPAIADVTLVYPEDRTYDENTGTFYFTSAAQTHSIISIDVSDGSIVNNPIINDIKAFQFDNSTNTLYALQHDNLNNEKKFISIDPVTGSYSQIGNSMQGSSMFSGGYSAFNELSHTYVFLSPPDILYSINATNGSILSNPSWVLAQEEYIINFTFDNSTGILYGILNDNILHKYFLVSINPSTGTNTRIGAGTTFGTGNGSVAIDEVNQQLIYMYHDGGFKISTFDIATGAVIYNAMLAPLNFPADNAYGLEYDNVQGKLYSIHWDATLVEPDTCTLAPITNFNFSQQNLAVNFNDESEVIQPNNWHWDFGDGSTNWQQNSNHTYDNGGTYIVSFTSCNDECCNTIIDTINVGETLIEDEVIIPNVFTPNDDDLNDNFIIKNLPVDATVQIYNRWGTLIAEWNNPDGSWDGRTKAGSEVIAGIYYYIINLPDTKIMNGFVQVIK